MVNEHQDIVRINGTIFYDCSTVDSSKKLSDLEALL